MKKLLITVNGKRYEVDVEVVLDDEIEPSASRPLVHTMDSYVTPVTAPLPTKLKPASGDPRVLTSPINGVILDVPVKEGQSVKENDVLFILEAMKMKTNISSPRAGKIKSIKVKVGDTVESGKTLLTFE